MRFESAKRATIGESQLAELTELINLVEPECRPGDPPLPPASVANSLDADTGYYHRATWTARTDSPDRLVGVGQLEWMVGDENQDQADALIGVHPDHHGQGHGKAILGHLEATAAVDGRRLLVWAELDDRTHAFFDSQGYEHAMTEQLSRLHLDQVDAKLMQSWVDRADDRASGYRLERWIGPCPDHLLDAYVQAKHGMNDAPTEGVEFESITHSAAAVRAREDLKVATDKTELTVLAVENATGAGAGFTAVGIDDHRTSHAEQSFTTTLDAHRNRGVGRWMKAAMWQWLRADRPDVEVIDTGNAASNAAMLAINVEMGFRPLFRYGCWQRATG